MRSEHVVLKTKLEPPMIDDQILYRKSVMKLLKRAGEKPLTLVQAGPGFGKSTAVSTYLRLGAHPFVWYTVTEQDDQISRFLLYFKEAIRTFVPTLDSQWLEEVFVNIQNGSEKAIYECCSYFINACVDVENDFFFIIDDFQIVYENEKINQFMSWFLLHLPKKVHVILNSRTKLTWDFLAMWRMKGFVIEINEKHLCFSPEEIQILFEDHYERPLTHEDVQFIFSKTEGWIMAIQMVWQRMDEGQNVYEIFQEDAQSMEELFLYLALDVLNKQEKDVYHFLIESSIFQNVTEKLCEDVLAISNGKELIFRVLNKQLFLQTTKKKEVFRYHSLFQEFLQNRLKKSPNRWEKLHIRAAGYFEKSGDFESALYHLEESGSKEKLLLFLHKNGQQMIRQGSLLHVEKCLQTLIPEEKDQYFRLWVVQGDIERFRSHYDKGLASYERAETFAQKHRDLLGETLALEGAARIYLDTIQPKHAQHLLKKAIHLLEETDDFSEKEAIEKDQLLRRLYMLMSENNINLGYSKEAEKWYEKSKAETNEEVETDLEARIYLRTGRLVEMIRRLEGRKKSAHYQKHPPKAHRETDILLSFVYSLLGREKEAKDAASNGLMQGVNAGSPFVEACGWMRMGHAIQLQDQYEQRLAVTCYETALHIMDEINVSRGKAEPYLGLSLLYGKKKSLQLALKYAHLGLMETERVDDLWLSTWLFICKGIAYVYAKQYEKAFQVLNVCAEKFQFCGDSYGLAVTTLWQAFAAYRMKDEERFYPIVHHFLQLVEKEGYDALLQRRTLFGPVDVQQLSPMLLEAYKHQKKEQPYLHHLMVQLGMDEARTNHPGYTLKIQTFQQFKVFRGDVEITEKDWKREKAKELFQLFVTKRKHLLQKEAIFHLLWEGQAEEVAARDFKVVLNTLNNVLEPHRKARTTPFFIHRHESAYGLNLAAPFELDSVQFERGVIKGLGKNTSTEEAIEYLSQALELYKGDYLPERIHEDWCLEERERLQVLYIRGCERLAQLYLQSGEEYLCISWAEKILEKDRCWEEAYYLLMEAYRRRENRKMVLHYYKKCKEVLAKELGVAPMEKIEKMIEQMGLEGGEKYVEYRS